jgi:polyisoprenoid-binding protein YceI
MPVSFAQPQQARDARKQAEAVEAEQLEPHQVSVQKSRVYIFVDKTGLGHQHGVEGRLKSGSLTLGAVEEAGEIVFDMNSFDADTDAARRYVGLSGSTDASTRRQVNDNMKNTSILNVAQFPTATFAIQIGHLAGEEKPNRCPVV